MILLHNPYYLLLIFLLPLCCLVLRRIKKPSFNYSSMDVLQTLTPSLKQRFAGLPTLLHFASLFCLIVALARPQAGLEEEHRATAGIAIEVAIDRSGSMQEQLMYQGRPTTRLDVVKDLFKDFALGNKEKGLPGRQDDLIGMVSFARFARTVCPLTLAHQGIEPLLNTINLARDRNEDGTAIGDAIALAAARLKKAEDSIQKQGGAADYTIKSKIIILLTDGQNNAGEKSPIEAAELAEKWGIKIYAIGVGGGIARRVESMFGSFTMPVEATVDVRSLQQIAKKTHGAFYLANDANSLKEIYQDIDKLEKTEFKATQSTHYKELFTPWALLAAVFLLLEVLLSCTVFRRLP